MSPSGPPGTPLSPEREFTLKLWPLHYLDDPRSLLSYQGTQPGSGQALIEARLHLSTTNSAHANINGRPQLPGIDWKLCESWIRECSAPDTHGWCNPIMDQPLPTRLLRVDKHTIKLVETSGQRGRYVTLSYCWGDTTPLCTTRANYDDHLASISFSTLPKMYQDAVEAVRTLGLHWLWIDALCILQFDSEDWYAESAQMEAIFANSCLTVAGPDAAHANAGFLQKTPLIPAVACVLKEDRRINSEIIISPQDPHQDESNSALAKRAWALQERVLSPRVLYFGSHQTYYVCRSGRRFESLHNMVIKGGYYGRDIFFFEVGPLKFAYFYEWYFLAEAYSRCSLTYQGDKLPALSGVAKRFRDDLTQTAFDRRVFPSSVDKVNHCKDKMVEGRRPGNYLAGIWSFDIWRGLLWARASADNNASQGRCEPARYELPSWSWTSCKYALEFKDRHDTPWTNLAIISCSLLSYNIDYVGHDTFGQIRSGMLEVRGPVIEGRLKTLDDNGDLESSLVLLTASHTEIPVKVTWDNPSEHQDHEYSFDGSGTCWVTLLVIMGRLKGDLWPVDALVLRKTESGMFTRIGYGLLHEDGGMGGSALRVWFREKHMTTKTLRLV